MSATNRLSALQVRNAPSGKYCDGGSLWLHKQSKDSGQWVLRFTLNGKRHEMGLGGVGSVSLKSARELADKWRGLAKIGLNPMREREKEARKQARGDNTLAFVTIEAFEARKAELREDGKAGRWLTPLRKHVLPKLGRRAIGDIDQRDIRDVLKPIWHSKADTARKALNRLSIVFRHAAALNLDVDIQATAKAKELLGKSRHQTTPIPALHWNEVPEFYASLAEPTIVHLALRLLILTGVRTKPVRFLQLDHVDGDIWTIPADLMKGLKGKTAAFRVPLSTEAAKVIDHARRFERAGYFFPGIRKGVISDATMARLMERRSIAARPHGFRSSLRTWLSEELEVPYEIAEKTIAHKTENAVQRVYNRTDQLEKRRELMERWAEHVTGKNN